MTYDLTNKVQSLICENIDSALDASDGECKSIEMSKFLFAFISKRVKFNQNAIYTSVSGGSAKVVFTEGILFDLTFRIS